MALKLTSDAFENTRNLAQIAGDARKANAGSSVGSLENSWAQNLKHSSGLLLDATRATLTQISGGYKHDGTAVSKVPPVGLNLILPRLTRFVARHLNLMGGVEAVAGTDDPKDTRQAKAAARMAEVLWENKGMDVASMRALIYMINCNNGYVMVEGDPNAHYRHEKDETDLWQAFNVGDVVYKAFSPLQVDVYPGIQELDDSPAIIVTDFLTAEYAKRRWGITIPEGAPTAKYDVAYVDALVPELDKVAYKVQRLFIKPSPTRPLGEHHIIIGEKVVYSSKTQKVVAEDGTVLDKGRLTIDTYDFKYPLIDFADAPISFGYHGYGRQTAARTVIKILCSVWSRMVQCAVGMPGVVVDIPENSNEEELGNKPYLLIHRNVQGGPIGFNAIPRMPHHEAMIDFCIRWLDEIYAQSPASRGQSPGSRFAAKGLEFLAQQDVLADTPTGKMVLKAMQKLFRRALGEGLRVWDDEHIEYILGEGKELEKIALKKGELKQGWDIFIMPGAGTLASPEAQRQEINASFESGLLPAEDARRLAGYYVKEEVFEPKRDQTRIVELEEDTFTQGLGVGINAYDDHELHLKEHDRTAARRHMLAEDMEVWRRQSHRVEHVEALGLQNQALLADQQAAAMEQKMAEEAGEAPPEQTPEGPEEPPEAPQEEYPDEEII